jgi:3-methyl-2-oxobutanoate hydroxymethyltransferase
MKITDFQNKKNKGEKITLVTCYDFPSARTISETHIDAVLVGDSVAMTVHGYESTIMATMEMMILHTSAVSRGLRNKFLISDLPFLCHRASLTETINNVKQLLQAGAHAIKIEGGDENVFETIKHLVNSGVPIMGHIGLMPQSVLSLGGFKVQGKKDTQAQAILKQAQKLQDSGCFAIVIECVPAVLAQEITQALHIPTIGIGAGSQTDGQVLVWHDLLGLQTEFIPRFTHQFAHSKSLFIESLNTYVTQVKNAHFPALEHTF